MEKGLAATLAAYELHHLASRSSLDLLTNDSTDSRGKDLPEQGDALSVKGAAAATIKRAVSKSSPRKPAEPKVSRRRGVGTRSQGDATGSNNNNEAKEECDDALHHQWLVERTRLLEELTQVRQELSHAREEKVELEESFRRLDREIADGYNLSARKEKEMRIAELQSKNQKLAAMLEKELSKQKELRSANEELVREHDSLQHRTELLTGLLRSAETRLNELSDAHAALTASYSAAQQKMETLQDRANELQDQLVSSTACEAQLSEYEDKLRRWERKCRALEQNLSNASDRAEDQQQSIEHAHSEAQRAVEDRDKLEMELRGAHDKLIQMTAALRAVEAKLESDLRKSDGISEVDALRKRVRVLEADLNERTRAYLEVKQAFNQHMSAVSKTQNGHMGSRRPATLTAGTRRGQASMDASKAKARVNALEEKLRRAEDSRDHKAHVVSVLMQALPFLMQQLDSISDKYQAATESNEILKGAIGQVQASRVDADDEQHQTREEAGLSPLAYLHLARENFALGAPLSVGLLAECSGTSALFDFGCERAHGNDRQVKLRPRNSQFAPFRVTTVASKPSQAKTNQEGETEVEAASILVIAADQDDHNGNTYLNRSKINLFLQFAQGEAARKKLKALLVSKLAECFSKMRELTWRSSSERVSYQATIQLLRREVSELKQRANQPLSDDRTVNERAEGVAASRRQVLLKLVDLYAEKQQQQRQSTFLTQAETSDVLITRTCAAQTLETSDGDVLCLQNLQLCDGDIEQLLWKILVSEAHFVEIQLDGNALSDTGANVVANFLAKMPESIQTLSLRGNRGISSVGIEEIRSGVVRNVRAHRVEFESSSNSLVALAATDDYVFTGKPAVIFRVLLPDSAVSVTTGADGDQDVDALVDALRDRGLGYEANRPLPRQSRASSIKPTGGGSRNDTSPTGDASAAMTAVIRLGTERRARAFKTRQQSKLQALEDALWNASSSSRRSWRPSTSDGVPSIATKRSLSTMPYTQPLSRRPGSAAGASKLGLSTTGRAHVSIVRGLRR